MRGGKKTPCTTCVRPSSPTQISTYPLITKYAGVQEEIDFLGDIEAGAYIVASFTGSGVARAVRVVDRYRDLDVGLTDASIVALAEQYETIDVLTLDERHFRSLRTENGQSFLLLPAGV